MRTLYLLRHAKSDWGEALNDFDRPLAPRGVRDAGRMAHHFQKQQIRPDVVLCSTARRARETLALLGVTDRDGDVRFVDELYGAEPTDVLAVVRKMPNHAKSVMVVGHNPTLSDLAGEDLPTLGLATIKIDTKQWVDAQRSTFELTGVVSPKMLRPR